MLHDDCSQRDKIDYIADTIGEMKIFQGRIVDLLEKVSSQEARLEHLEDHSDKTLQDMNELFGRVRDVELNQAANGSNFRDRVDTALMQLDSKMKRVDLIITVLGNKYVILSLGAVAIMTVVGAVMDFVYHYDAMKRLLDLVRG
jgi:ABC-type Fe3+/spermidine/putrescine transport system ATPase subunit